MKVSDEASTRKTYSNANTMTMTGYGNIKKRKKHTSFEWIHLIATICIPIIIAIYSIIDNNKKESIAVGDRLKDMDIANSSRLAELEIAEQNRQKDRELALDQQREDILAQYQTFMANLLIENGMALNKTPTAKPVALSMTLTTLSQLDTRRKGILIRSLYHSKLITLHKNSQPYDSGVLQLGFIDLSDITFGPSRNAPAERPWYLCVDWYYLWLPNATFTNASFRHTCLKCATLSGTFMDSVDLSFTLAKDDKCFGAVREELVTFAGSSLVNASFYKAHFWFTSFDRANLTFANMRELHCMKCSFLSATLFQVDLSFSLIYANFMIHPERLVFNLTNLRHAVIHSAIFRSISFFQSDWSYVQAFQMTLHNCTFINASMEHCSLTKSWIHLSLFQNASLFSIDLSYTTLDNVSFIDSDMRNANMSSMQCNYCNFTNVKLQGAVFKNASLRNSTFLNCDAEVSQFEQAIDLYGSILPNRTVVKYSG